MEVQRWKIPPLALFEHEKFGSLRVVRSDQGAQWFVAKDVCGCLGLDTSNLSKMLDEDELSTYPVQYTDQVRNLSVVSEPGLYSLILRSRKPEAKAFKRWVTHEVIPSIRKTGAYATNNALTMPNFSNPAEAARAWADEYEAKQRSALILLKRMSKPPFLDRFGGSCYRKVVTPRADSIGLVLQ
jgi:anti-repressor protein